MTTLTSPVHGDDGGTVKDMDDLRFKYLVRLHYGGPRDYVAVVRTAREDPREAIRKVLDEFDPGGAERFSVSTELVS